MATPKKVKPQLSEKEIKPKLFDNKKIIEGIRSNFNNFIKNFNPKDTDYQVDALQQEMIKFYLTNDSKFRRAFSTNFTNTFITYLKDKSRLQEPYHLSVLGITRSGKTSIGMTIGFITNVMYDKLFDIKYVAGNELEFLEKIKDMAKEETNNCYFQIDEQKHYFGLGKMAKATKLLDVQNIIAKHNISTSMLCPTDFANEKAHYGLRTFGRCFKTKSVRLMVYNLQESVRKVPMGMIYLPIPEVIVPKEYWKYFNDAYQAKKDEWIGKEIEGKGDILGEVKRGQANNFLKDEQFIGLTKKKEKITYIAMKLGSDWTKGEVDEIYSITELMNKGINLEKE